MIDRFARKLLKTLTSKRTLLRQVWSQRPELAWLFTAMCSVSHFWPQQRCEFDARDQKCALSAWLPAEWSAPLGPDSLRLVI
jgi:hypothetical protein